MDYEIRCPQTSQEWWQYYDLRYRILRKPWKQPLGSEKNEGDLAGKHLALFISGKIVAVTRLDKVSEKESQVRFVAVDDGLRGNGFGQAIMKEVEEIARTNRYEKVVLHARENAVEFYKSIGYTIEASSYLLFETIQHYYMTKHLNK